MRLSVCAFYIRVEALYTLKHHPAESVTSDFFIADPNVDCIEDSYAATEQSVCSTEIDQLRLAPYSMNVLHVVMYIRGFTYEVGVTVVFSQLEYEVPQSCVNLFTASYR